MADLPLIAGAPEGAVRAARRPGRQMGHERIRYWAGAPAAAVALVAVIAVRLPELVPATGKLQPALSLGALVIGLLLLKSSQQVVLLGLGDKAFRLAAAYAAWAIITVPFALYRGDAIKAAKAFLPALLIVLCIALCPPVFRSVDRISRGWVIAAVVMALGCMAIGVTSMDAGGIARLASPGSYDPNDLAGLMAISSALCLGLVARGRGVRRLFWLICLSVLLACLMKTGSRGGGLAVIFGAVLFVLGFRLGRAAWLLAVLGLVGIGLGLWGPAGFRERMGTVSSLDQDYNMTDRFGRKAIAIRGIGYFVHNPVLGVGVGNFQFAEGQYNRTHGLTGKWSAPHNSYVQAFAELGAPGGLLFLGLLAVSFAGAGRVWRPKRKDSGLGSAHRPELLAAIGAFALGGFFLSHAYFYPLFALVALISLARRSVAALQPASRPRAAPCRRRGL